MNTKHAIMRDVTLRSGIPVTAILQVDHEALLEQLVIRARASKHLRASAMKGAVKVRLVTVKKP